MARIKLFFFNCWERDWSISYKSVGGFANKSELL